MAPAAPAIRRMAGEEAGLAAEGQVTQAHMGCPGPGCGSCEIGGRGRGYQPSRDLMNSVVIT